MSYDLVFWKQASECTDPPSHILQLLVAGEMPDCLEEIPPIGCWTEFGETFPGIISVGGLEFWEGEDRGMFAVSRYRVTFTSAAGGCVAGEMNRLIEIAHEFDCPCMIHRSIPDFLRKDRQINYCRLSLRESCVLSRSERRLWNTY